MIEWEKKINDEKNHFAYKSNFSDDFCCFFLSFSLFVLALICVVTSSWSWEKNALDDIDFLLFFSWNKEGNCHTLLQGMLVHKQYNQ